MADPDFNTAGLDKLIKAMTDDRLATRIGVIGDKATRKANELNNAEIGAKHEMGLDGMPVRSWLRMPLIQKMQKYLLDAGAFDKNAIKQIMKDKSLITFKKKIGIVAETAVSDAFDTGGFGQWKPSNMAFKTNHQTLVETQQLRRSVISEVISSD